MKLLHKLIEKLPRKYQNIYASINAYCSVHLRDYYIFFMSFLILNIIVFSIGSIFLEITIWGFILSVFFNAVWMSMVYNKINGILIKKAQDKKKNNLYSDDNFPF